MRKLFKLFFGKKSAINTESNIENNVELTEEEEIKNGLYDFWNEYTGKGYQIQAYKEGELVPDIKIFNVIIE